MDKKYYSTFITGLLLVILIILGWTLLSGEGDLDISIRRAGEPAVEGFPTVYHQGDHNVFLLDFILENHTAEDAEISTLYLRPTTFLDDMPGESLNDTVHELAAVGKLILYEDATLLATAEFLPPGTADPEISGSVITGAEYSIPLSPPFVLPGDSQKAFRLVFDAAVSDIDSRVLWGATLRLVRAHDPGDEDSIRTVVNTSEDASRPGEPLSSANSIWMPRLWTLGSSYLHIDP